MDRKKNRAPGNRRELAVKFQTGFIIAAFLLSIAAIIWNASELKHVLLNSTVLYVEDVAYQQASGIIARLKLTARHWNRWQIRLPIWKKDSWMRIWQKRKRR